MLQTQNFDNSLAFFKRKNLSYYQTKTIDFFTDHSGYHRGENDVSDF